jgi:exodeoxyribonuclease V gamma subunit
VLHLHRSERTDALIEPLARLLTQPLDDPFVPEVVAVPTRGVERWLAQRLSHHLGSVDGEAGVCANVAFCSPQQLVEGALGAALTADRDMHPDDDPWQPDRLTWAVLEILDASAGEAWCEPVDRYLGNHLGDADEGASHRRSRRYSLASHVARLFTSYASQRPWVLQAWAAGRDEGGAGGPVPGDLAWQRELWLRLRELVGVPSPAEQLQAAVERLREDAGSVDLPSRLSVFGPTRIPEDQLQVLSALAAHRDVHLWLLQPSPVVWERVDPAGADRRRRARVAPARHPLLASLSRDAVELAERLKAISGTTSVPDLHHPAGVTPSTTLGRLQQQLRDDEPPTALEPVSAPAGSTAPVERSIQVHSCHGRARQVEVLREVLLQLFAEDPTLEPRDVLVMCPDIEEFAPLISATFGLSAEQSEDGAVRPGHPGQRLRVRLADRSLRQTNPLLSLLAQLLTMADGRVTASEVLDLAAAEPVRRRFGFDDDALDRIQDWAVASGVRWGENLERRRRFGLERVGQGTWEAALDRILLGAAMADDDQRFIGTALPLDDVDSTDIDLAGRLAEFVERLSRLLERLDGAMPLSEWLDVLDVALDQLAEAPVSEAWQGVQARRILGEVRLAGAQHGQTRLRLPDVRALLAGRLQGRPTRASFRTGHLTMCSMVPMRSVPHRVICLLGMDDGTFPRGSSSDGDNLLLREPLIGERDRRTEDRQLFLDAVMAAQDHLVVLYSGADERTGAERAPAVPVGELLDAVDSLLGGSGASGRAGVVVRHPLQPFDPRNFTPGALGWTGPASFDATALAAARAALGDRRPVPPFLPAALPDPPKEDVIDLGDLVRFLEHPVKAFLRERLDVVLPSRHEEVSDRLPLQAEGLEQWAIGDRLLTARLAGAHMDRATAAEWRRGFLPPGELGKGTLRTVMERVEPIVTAAEAFKGDAGSVDVAVELPDGRLVSGTVGVRGSTLLRVVYSSLGAKHRLRAWVQLLMLAASEPDVPWSAVTIGRGAGKRPAPRKSTLQAPSEFDARLWLEQLVDVRDRGMRTPLPMPVKTAAAYATCRFAGESVEQAEAAANREWPDGRYSFGEAGEAEHQLVWGSGAPISVLLSQQPSADEARWWLDETTRFGQLARRVWHPLLDAERTESL